MLLKMYIFDVAFFIKYKNKLGKRCITGSVEYFVFFFYAQTASALHCMHSGSCVTSRPTLLPYLLHRIFKKTRNLLFLIKSNVLVSFKYWQRCNFVPANYD